ncbi:uncharacterized protein JCM15063_005660 [Sporobolomyces koalae]|uniref:uncharacterized protein n=1 Tax=Sporobolomyces koalae TaxID=500713 RepID=UPI00317DAE2F
MRRTREELVQHARQQPGYAYGLDDREFARVRLTDYPALKDTLYLDYAASPPTPVLPVQRLATTLASTLYANPHSASTAGVETALVVAKTRSRVLTDLFNVPATELDEWDLVFTQGGATRGIQMVGDAWHWQTSDEMGSDQIALRYLTESHTSLVGLRGVALARSASVEAHSTPSSLLAAAETQSQSLVTTTVPTLYTYPAQCNATGSRLGLDFAKQIKARDPRAVVLVDAAAYCATKVLDLGSISDENTPDAVVGSFYKVFGWPTSLGFLVVRRTAAHRFLSTPHFGGGSISSLSLGAPFSVTPRTGPKCAKPTVHARLEQGTLPFLEILALNEAMDWFHERYGSLNEVEAHVATLRTLATALLEDLRHEPSVPGEEPSRVFCEHRAFAPLPTESSSPNLETPGPTIGFSLLAPAPINAQVQDHRQTHVGVGHLSRLAIVNGISMRTGGLCNAGVWTRAFGVDDYELRELEKAGRACWDDQEYSPFFPHRPLGIARISLGAASTIDDVLGFVDFVKKFFVRGKQVTQLRIPNDVREESSAEVRRARLGSLLLYPIKSCAAQSVLPEESPDGWPITATGLQYDREFMLVEPGSGKALSQKKYPRMALIKPSIDLERGVLVVRATGMNDLVLPLPELVACGTPPLSSTSSDGDSLDSLELKSTLLCDELVQSNRVSPLADQWFANFLKMPSIQLRRLPLDSTSRHAHFESNAGELPTVPLPLRLSNESPFLLVSESSVRQVSEWRSDREPESQIRIHHSAFRPNFVVDDLALVDQGEVNPFWEDQVELVQIGSLTFANLGRCRRCLMVGIDQETGQRTKEPLSTLSKHRKSNKSGRVEFGVHMHWRDELVTEDTKRMLKVGDEIKFRICQDSS